MLMCRFNRLLKKHGVDYVPSSLPTEHISLTCQSSLRGVRRSETVVANGSTQQYFDATRFFASLSTVDDVQIRGRSTLAEVLRRRTADSQTSAFECRSGVDEETAEVDWASVRLVFVVLDVLLLIHRLTKLHIEVDRMRLSTPGMVQFSPLSDGYAEGISFLPVDGVEPTQTILTPEPALRHVINYTESERHGSGDDDVEVNAGESTANSLCVTLERCGSNSVIRTPTRPSTGSRFARRRRIRNSSDVVPRLVCLVALLVALFYARTLTMSRGVLWFHNALPFSKDKLPSMFASGIGRHFYDDVGVDSLSNNFRQLQAFVDFFNSGTPVIILIIIKS